MPYTKRWSLAGLFSALAALVCVRVAMAAPLKYYSDQGAVPARATPLGRVDTSEKISFALTLPLRNPARLQALIGRIYDPSDPLYHHYLTVDQFVADFGPTQSDYDQLIATAKADGLTVESTSPNRLLLHVCAPSATVESLFSVKMMRYQDETGRVFHAPGPLVALPDDLTRLGGDVIGLNTGPTLHHTAVRITKDQSHQEGSGVDDSGFTPSDLRTIYDFDKTTINPSGQTMGLVELDTYKAVDVDEYANQYGLATPNLDIVSVDGGVASPGEGQLEVELDIDMTLALASSATLRVYEAPNNTLQNAVDIYNQIATDNISKTNSTSWGLDETSAGSAIRDAENSVFMEMAGQGQSLFAATGDNGAYDNSQSLSVDDPSSQPYCTGVGGTTLTVDSNEEYISETAWGDPTDTSESPFGSGSGGGISQYWSIPSYQAGITFNGPSGQFSTSFRDTPDVSLVADPNTGVSVYYTPTGRHGGSGTGSWVEVGGTSDAAPIWSAITAMVNQQLAASSDKPAGFLNPLLYGLYKDSTKYARDFHDITEGNNLYYNAYTGYDCATGLGTPVGADIIADLVNAAGGPPSFPANISLSPDSASPGSAAITMTVSGSNFLPGAVVYWNGGALTTTYVSGTQLTADVPASLLTSAGTASVYVGNPDGTSSAAVTFTIATGGGGGSTTPTVSSIDPANATAGSAAFTLTVTGTNFVSGSTVFWNTTSLSTTFSSSTSLTATVPATLVESAGTASVSVENPSGSTSNGVTFTITAASAPSIIGLSPSSATAGSSAFTLTVDGSGFVSNSEVEWNGSALATTFVSSTQLTATVTSALIASAGTASISVLNPSVSLSSSTVSYTITSSGPSGNPAPSISSVSPASLVISSSSEVLRIFGANFLSSTTVTVNSSLVVSTFVNSAEIDITVPGSLLGSAGTLTIVVTTPSPGGGSAQTSVSVTNPGPTITSINPTTAFAQGNAFTLTVIGQNFLPGSVINFGDTTLATTYDSATQLQGSVPATAISSVGAISVSVTNPAPGGGTSTAVQFTVQPSVLYTFPAGLQMITAPGDFSFVSLSEALSSPDTLLAIWDPTNEVYDITPTAPANAFSPGLGYWVRFSSATNLYNVGSALPSAAYFSINLSPGWNMIGSPFTEATAISSLNFVQGSNAAVAYATAISDNLINAPFYTYNSSTAAYASETNNLEPYVGYWLYAFVSCTMQIPTPTVQPLQ